MNEREVARRELDLQDDNQLLLPPWLAPLYACATSVTAYGFLPHAKLEVEVDGAVTASQQAGFPEPQGETIPLPAPLVAGQSVRVRQVAGALVSGWSPAVVARDHLADYPAGPPRPQIDPAPVYECGVRTGVGNLLAGGNVWITADGVEVGRVAGCTPKQGVNVNPAYTLNQRVRAWFELCADPSPPSAEQIAQPRPIPVPAPTVDPMYEEGEQVAIGNVVNGARVTLSRNGVVQGTWGCWGGALLVTLSPPFSAGETFSATQQMCPGDAPGGAGVTTVQPCSALPAPRIGPIQGGDTQVTVVSSVPGAVIKVYVNFTQVGIGSGPVIQLTQPVRLEDRIHVVQDLGGCQGSVALEGTVACVDPPVTYDPAWLDLFPVGFDTYDNGSGVRGSVYYPAADDGDRQPFNPRLGQLGRVPIVVMAHGNHSPADPSYLGYDYFQIALAKMGIVAVSVDCNALNGAYGGVQNIEDRADLIIDSIVHFQQLDAAPASTFSQRIDFSRLGLMGHSRGGDAVVTIPTAMGLPGVSIRGVLALAPTNFRYWYGLPTIVPSGYEFMTILPAGDGDVVDNNGAQFYDQAKPRRFKSQLHVHYTNHNFFNRQWLYDDGAGPVVLARAEHENVLSAYGCAFFRSVLLGHGTASFLTGYQRPPGTFANRTYLAFERAEQVTVDNHEDGNAIGVNSLGLPTSQAGGMNADEYPFDQVAGAYNASFYGLTTGMVVKAGGTARTFRSEIGTRSLGGKEIWIRAAEVFEDNAAGRATGFEIGLEDAAGVVSWVDSDAVGGLPRPYPNPFATKTMLKTVRVKADCFAAVERRINLDKVDAILLRCNRPDERSLAFDDLQIVS